MVKLNKIYTRTGDDGSTGLVDGSRVSKAQASTVCGGAERIAVLFAHGGEVNPHALTYLNRLSDFLFVAGRWCNDQGEADVKWIPGANR